MNTDNKDEIRILAAIVTEAPCTGYVTFDQLDDGVPGVSVLDLAPGCRNLVQAGLLGSQKDGLQITAKGWAWIQTHRLAVAVQLTSFDEVSEPYVLWLGVQRQQIRRRVLWAIRNVTE